MALTQLRACSCRWSMGLWGCRPRSRRDGGGLRQNALDGGVPGAGWARNLDRRARRRLGRAGGRGAASKGCLRGRSPRRGGLSGYLYRWALRSPTCPRTPTPTRSRGDDLRLRVRDLRRGSPPRGAQARAAGSRWGSCERARGGDRWASGLPRPQRTIPRQVTPQTGQEPPIAPHRYGRSPRGSCWHAARWSLHPLPSPAPARRWARPPRSTRTSDRRPAAPPRGW